MKLAKLIACISLLLLFVLPSSKADWVYQDWQSWDSLGIEITNAIKKYAQLKADDQKLVDSIIQFARTDSEKGDFIVYYIKQNIISIHSADSLYANNIEYAFETLKKGEGILIDKAVLAKAMFERAGLMANPVCISNNIGDIALDGVNIKPFRNIQVWISGEDFEAVYDPATDIITTGLEPIFGRTIWMPGLDNKPVVRMPSDAEPGEYSVTIDLHYDEGNSRFIGTGLLKATGCMTPYDQMYGLNNESFNFLDSLVSGLFDGAGLTRYNLSRFDFFNITAGFEFQFDQTLYLENSINLTPGHLYFGALEKDSANSQMRFRYRIILCPINEKLLVRYHVNENLLKIQLSRVNIENNSGTFETNSIKENGAIKFSRNLSLLDSSNGNNNINDRNDLIIKYTQTTNKRILFKRTR